MTPEDIFNKILKAATYSEQQQILKQYQHLLNHELAHLLRQAADEFLRRELEKSDRLADLLLYQAKLMDDPLIEALALRTKANAYTIGHGAYEKGIEYYDQAAAIYQRFGLTDQVAILQAGRLVACGCLGRHKEALDSYEWAISALEGYDEWLRIGNLHLNAGTIYGRQGEDVKALVCFELAIECYERVGEDAKAGIAWVTQDIAHILRNQGKFEESIAYCDRAYELLSELGQSIEAARTLHITAETYIVLGRYNDAHLRLIEAHEIFEDDKRPQDVALINLDIVRCLLQLRRFPDILNKCRQSQLLFERHGVHFELGQSFLYEAIAYIYLGNYGNALKSLAQAHFYFVQQQSPMWATTALLEQAMVFYKQEDYTKSLDTAQECLDYLEQHELPVQTIQAYLTSGRAAIALKDFCLVQQMLERAWHLIQQYDIPTLLYEYYYLQGKLLHAQDISDHALEAYRQAIEYLERQRGQLMVEFRPDFLTDKEDIYQDIVKLYVDIDQLEQSFKYVEQAKSRALLDLLTHRIDMSLQSRSPEDDELIRRLGELRQGWDELYYSQFADQKIFSQPDGHLPLAQERRIQKTSLEVEKDITDIWHQLLMRNADYAGDAALWQIRVESVQPYLDSQTILLEYFEISDTLWLFVVTAKDIKAYPLPATLTTVQGTLNRLLKKMNDTPNQPESKILRWTKQTQKLLQRLYDNLIAPVQELLEGFRHIYIVPHGPLHYLPFHALHNRNRYLSEDYSISYLPSASYLHYCQHNVDTNNSQIFAHSSSQQLPNTIKEAKTIGQLLEAQVYLEEEATIEKLREVVTDCNILHLATHGDFRADNPLFSGLVLDDGLLTTLDIFNLRLNSNLVTLSACQTGRSVVGGGDELLGLTRAFLSAGANALLLSLWAVEDHSTALLMEKFYKNFSAGQLKSTALRDAQLALMHHEKLLYRHPYFWAPFILIGNVENT